MFNQNIFLFNNAYEVKILPFYIEALTKQGRNENFVAMSETEKESVLARFERRGYLKIKSSKVEF